MGDPLGQVVTPLGSVRECHLTAEAVVPGLDRLERLIA
jgi:hypothetical protein